MATFLLRVELPDRPGALGAVASRIGSVRGDVVAVEVVERRPGSAVDEFIVELADEDRLPLLLTEVGQVDGVSVEEIHPVSDAGRDRRLDAYDTAVIILQERVPQDILAALATRVRSELDALWAAFVDVEGAMTIAAEGRPPAAPWLASYFRERRPGQAALDAGGDEGDADAGRDEDDVVTGAAELSELGWAHLASWDLVLAVGRPGWSFGTRELARLAALARLADARWVDLAERDPRSAHPSCTG